MLRFLSQDLTIAKRSIGGTEEGSYLGHLLLMKPLGFFRGLISWQWEWQKVHVLSKDDLSIFCNVGLVSCDPLRLTSIAHYEMKQGTWHLYIVSQFWHQPGLGIHWKGLGLDYGYTQCLDPEACMSNTSLWALAINLWNGARTGEENWETALDFLTSCWIKKQWEALPFLTEASSLPMKFPASVSMVGTVPL